MTNKYIGLTIGPIYKTLTSVKATREIWGASYIFSYIMKKIIKKLKESGKKFIIPYTDDSNDSKMFESGQEVGLFHDRFIFKAESDDSEGDLEEVEKIKNKVLEEIAEEMTNVVGEKEQNKIYEFLKKYFQIYFCEKEIKGDYKEVNKEINNHLDVLELQSKFIPQISMNYLFDFFDKINSSFLIKDAFGKTKSHSFPSIPEIAALKGRDDLLWEDVNRDERKSPQKVKKKSGEKTHDTDDTDDTTIYGDLKAANKDKFKQYHKYIAIVQADGDNLGKTIEALESDSDFTNLSKALFDFSKNAHKKIKEFGGITIYAGGDDLLFFAPIVSNNKSVFELVHDLGKSFENNFKEFDKKQKPTLSAGISITYYKYPMGEALENATNLLSNKAKNFKDKNAVAFEVQKHSGQSFSGVFNKDTNEYLKFKQLIQCNTEDKMLTSLIHKLNFHNAIIKEIGKDKTKIKNYFKNFFNEEEHNKFKDLFNLTAELINNVYNSYRNDKQKTELIYSALRLKKFIGGER